MSHLSKTLLMATSLPSLLFAAPVAANAQKNLPFPAKLSGSKARQPGAAPALPCSMLRIARAGRPPLRYPDWPAADRAAALQEQSPRRAFFFGSKREGTLS